MGSTKMETVESYALSGESHPILGGMPLSSGDMPLPSGGTSLRNEGREQQLEREPPAQQATEPTAKRDGASLV